MDQRSREFHLSAILCQSLVYEDQFKFGNYRVVCMGPERDVGGWSSIRFFNGGEFVGGPARMFRQVEVCRNTIDEANHAAKI